jgi:hypothetical protein
MIETTTQIEIAQVVLSVMIGFSLTLLVGFLSWCCSLAVKTFLNIVMEK